MASQAPANISVSKHVKEIIVFTVVVQNFWNLTGDNKIYLSVDDLQDKKLTLQLYQATANPSSGAGDLSCHLFDEVNSFFSPGAHYVVTLYHKDGHPNAPFSKAIALNTCNFVPLISNAELRAKYCSANGTVSFNISIIPTNQFSVETNSGSIVQQRIRSLYLNPQHADVMLIVDGERLPAHKNILCSSSPVFEAMFQHPMQEAAINEVVIVDHSSPAVKAMLHYLYTGSVPTETLQPLVLHLLSLATFYQIQDLTQYVGRTMTIGFDNIKELLKAVPQVVAANANQELLARVMQFITQYGREILSQQPDVLDEVDLETCRLVIKAVFSVPVAAVQK